MAGVLDIEKKNLNVSKTKPVAPWGHPLLLLLFFQNKSCMHNKVGTCTEILPKSFRCTIMHKLIIKALNETSKRDKMSIYNACKNQGF